MSQKKKIETVSAVDTKADVVTEAVKKTVAEPAAEAAAEKPAKKPAAKSAAKTTKAAAPKETVKIQFGADEYNFADIKKAVEADYKAKFNGAVKTVEIYIKPEDKAAYYVINSDFADKIEL